MRTNLPVKKILLLVQCAIAAAVWLTASDALAQAPTISSFSPISGTPGTAITVRGENLLGVTRVTFNGVDAVFTPFLSTRLSVVVPDGALTGPISVTTPSGTAISADTFTFINPNAPVVTAISPIEGKPGSSVRIDGDHLTTATSVRFNGKEAAFSVVAGVLFGTVPTSATSGPLTVTTPDGVSTSTDSFTVLVSDTAPKITGFSPLSGTAGSTTLQIQGANLSTVTAVTFNGVPATFSYFAGILIVKVPANATTGPITVTSPTGVATSATSFTVNVGSLPVITSFSPASGPRGSTVKIDGSNLANATAVRFAGFTATFSAFGSSVLATVPMDAITGPVTIATPSGSFTTSTLFTITAATQASITDFAPVSGEPGATVEIHGTNLADATAVDFNGVSAGFTVLGGSVIATIPAAAVNGPISVTTPSGKVTSAASFTVVTPSLIPVVTSFLPTSGPIGTVVEIRGTNLTGVTTVRFSNTDAKFTNLFSGLISAVVPDNAGTGPITIISPTSTNITGSPFVVTTPIVLPLPVITSFTPTNGLPGTTIAITGTNLANIAEVRFNGVLAPFAALTGTNLTAIVPTNALTGPITISTPAGIAVSATSFEIPLLPAPQITSFTPASAVGGASVEVHGTGFENVASVKFNGTAAQFTPVSSTLLTAIVPDNATDGPLTVATIGGTASSTAVFHRLLPPAITGFTPATATAGTTVTIQGANFTTVTSVKFNGVEAVFKVDSAASVTAAVPAAASTGKITVTNVDGIATSTANFEISKPFSPPQITGFTPAKGTAGTTVTLQGAGFVDITSVKFNGIEAVFKVDSAASITVAVPATATTGKITVANAGGSGASTASFEVTKATPPAPPTISIAAFTDHLDISWADTADGFVLEESAELGNPAAWKTAAPAPAHSGGRFTASVPSTVGFRFYRLFHP
jgi:hypothetical protein